MSELLLDVQGLRVAYGNARVVENLSLRVSAGEIVGLVGPNGAGKTSTLRAISGAIARTAQRITMVGEELPPRPDLVARLGIAHVPEGRGLFGSLTVRQNIELGAAALGTRVTATERSALLRVIPSLDGLFERRAGQLSGGQQQMVAVARGVVSGARVLMIDELSLGLAPAVVTELLTTLQSLARSRRMGLLLVDQNVRALSRICDRAYTLRDGISVEVDLRALDVLHSDYLGRQVDR